MGLGKDNAKKGMLVPSYPFRVEFEITSACNLNCIYCYAKPLSNIIPPIDDIKYLFGKTEDEAQPFEVIMVGGEPFLRKDIVDVLQYARNTFDNSSIGVSTNGTLLPRLTEVQLAGLKDISDDQPMIQVSIDSTDNAINDLTRGFGKLAMEGIRVLDKHEIPFSVGIVPSPSNFDNILKTVRSMLTEFDSLRIINVEILQPTYTMDGKSFSRLSIGPEKQRRLRETVRAEVQASGRKDVRLPADSQKGSVECSNPVISSYGFTTCTAGLFRAGVFVDGTVTPCLLLRDVQLGNLFEESWATIWEKSRDRFFGITEDAGQCTIANLLRKNSLKGKQKVQMRA